MRLPFQVSSGAIMFPKAPNNPEPDLGGLRLLSTLPEVITLDSFLEHKEFEYQTKLEAFREQYDLPLFNGYFLPPIKENLATLHQELFAIEEELLAVDDEDEDESIKQAKREAITAKKNAYRDFIAETKEYLDIQLNYRFRIFTGRDPSELIDYYDNHYKPNVYYLIPIHALPQGATFFTIPEGATSPELVNPYLDFDYLNYLGNTLSKMRNA